MELKQNLKGNYRFLSGISPFSSGVSALKGFEIVHLTLQQPMPYRNGFNLIEKHLASLGRPRHALCAVELRSPSPLTFEGFDRFNQGYQDILADWELLIDGNNPIARTNIVPLIGAPREPSLYAFSYTVPKKDNHNPSTFVISGAGEMGKGKRSPERIVRYLETTPEALEEKALRVMEILQSRMEGLSLTWAEVTAIDIYTSHPINTILPNIILKAVGQAAIHGVRWLYGRPPIIGLEFEMDLRGTLTDIVL